MKNYFRAHAHWSASKTIARIGDKYAVTIGVKCFLPSENTQATSQKDYKNRGLVRFGKMPFGIIHTCHAISLA